MIAQDRITVRSWAVMNAETYVFGVNREERTMDRSEINRALAKAIAYKNCGKDADAAEWARKLVKLLECAEILAS